MWAVPERPVEKKEENARGQITEGGQFLKMRCKILEFF